MPTVGILYLCTGKYRVFWQPFYENFKRYFLPDCEKTFFVFTDAAHIENEDAPDVRRIYQQAYAWPYSTLRRFEVFLTQAETLAGLDYLFFANANLSCTGAVHAAELLPDAAKGQTLVAGCHLAYYGKNPIFHPYERRPRCRAAIPYNCGRYYVAGGLNGGTATAYLAMCRTLQQRIAADLAEDLIAVHHDESQLNRLVAEAPAQFRILGPEFCVPEETPIPGERIRVLQKSHFIDIGAVKGRSKPQSFFARKWEAFNLNWMPYAYLARDTVLGKHL